MLTLSELRRLGLRILAALAALQVFVVGVQCVMDELRKRRQGPREGFPWLEGPEVELESGESTLKLYPYGVRLYEAMLEEIERAEEMIFVGIANVVVPPSFKRFPEEIHTLHFRPLWGPEKLANPRNVFRYHKHLMAADGQVAFLGGYNIGSLYAAGWRDTHVEVRGLGARAVENDFVDFWNAHRTPDLPKLEPAGQRSWDPSALFHRNDPYMRIFPIRAMYLEAIDRANEHIYLTHAYFIPDRAMRAGLADAARRGVDVQVLLP